MEDQPMDLIIGLDLLKRHQCNIDLMNNQLVIGSTGTRLARTFFDWLPFLRSSLLLITWSSIIIDLKFDKKSGCHNKITKDFRIIADISKVSIILFRTSFLAENELPKHARLTQKSSQAELQDIEDMEIQNALEASRADQPGPSSKGFGQICSLAYEYLYIR